MVSKLVKIIFPFLVILVLTFIISQDKELRRIAELKDKYIRDEKNMLSHAREDVQIEIASKLLKMSMSIEKISEVTGLDEKEIIKIKNNM